MEQKSKIDDVEGGGGGVVKSVALQAVAASAVLCGGVSGAAEIRYALDEPAFVTIAVEDASGRRVRNLVSAQRREAGECGETWDGFDDAGNPCAAGVYRWRGLAHGGTASRFLGAFDSEGVKKVFDPHAPPAPGGSAAPLPGACVVLDGVSSPRSLAIGAAGDFLVGDAALGRCCVEVFSPAGRHLRVKDSSPWVNGGGDRTTPFKTGDCIDLRWAADASADSARPDPVPGDIRILFAPDDANGAAAVRYAFSDPSVPDKARHAFSSPVGTAWVDRIDHPQIEAAITRTDDGYDFSADIPWEVLGEKAMPTHGETRRADVGVLFGDADGGRTVRRAYLFDQESQIVDDLPGEVRVRPANWGELHF